MLNLNFVQVENDTVLIDSRKYCSEVIFVDHSDWLQNTIYKHRALIEREFGSLRFQNGANFRANGKYNPNPEKYILLTESQCNFALSLSKNTIKVVENKALLIKDFEKAKLVIKENLERQFEAVPNDLAERLAKSESDLVGVIRDRDKHKKLFIRTIEELSQIKSQNTTLLKEVSDLTQELKTSKFNVNKLKLQRDNYYDQLQTLKANKNLQEEDNSNESKFPRTFSTLFSHVQYVSKRYLFFHVMLDLLQLKEGFDYQFDGQSYASGKVNYKKLKLSESAFQAILAFGRPSAGLSVGSDTPRKLSISRSFLEKHNTSKDSKNTFQPKSNS